MPRLRRAPPDLGQPRLRTRDLVREAWLSVSGNPTRSLLTALGTMLAAAAFVATLGLSATVAAQVSDEFDVRRATEVVVRPADDHAGPATPAWQSTQARDRLAALNGVEAAGARLALPDQPVRRTADSTADTASVRVLGLHAGALDVVEPNIRLGRTFDTFHDRTAAPVVLLSSAVADQLGITRVGVAVFVGDRTHTVIGIYDDVVRHPETMTGVLMPFDTAARLPGTGAERDFVIRTAPGAATLIGDQAALALSPEDPRLLVAVAPPDTPRRAVDHDLARLSLVLSLIALAAGTVSIGIAAMVGVHARAPELGLRRAVGAQPKHIFAQLLAETTVLGWLGGLLGAGAGVLVTVTFALARSWQPVVDLPTVLVASVAGALAGLLAGVLPAWQATRIQPATALQR
ncbi:ABC transporter permease [Actinophytocola sediminis]